jgi:hypothetical protein
MAADPKDFVVFDESLGIFKCASKGGSCQIGFLTLKTIHTHLKTVHGFIGGQADLPKWIKDKMPRMAQGYDDPRLEPYLCPTSVLAPIKDIRIEKGFGCRNCHKGFRAEGTFRNHVTNSGLGCLKTHKEESDIQKLFNGQKDSYYRVQRHPQLDHATQELLAKLSRPALFMEQSTLTRGDSTTTGWINRVSTLGLEHTVLYTLLPTDPFTSHFGLLEPLQATITAWISHFFNDIYPSFSDSTRMALCSGKPG